MGDARKGSELMGTEAEGSTPPPACPLLLTRRSCGSGLTSRATSFCIGVYCCNRRDSCARLDSSPLSDVFGCIDCMAGAEAGRGVGLEPGGVHVVWLG